MAGTRHGAPTDLMRRTSTSTETSDRAKPTLSSLLSMSRTQLDELYRRSPAGEIPDGHGEGAALLTPGTSLAKVAARIIRLLFWQGKVFDRQSSQLRNSITVFRVLAVKADVYQGPSRLDGKASIILDYSRTSLLARWVRDEIREVSPGLYLGLAYVFRIRVIWFALSFNPGPTYISGGPDSVS